MTAKYVKLSTHQSDTYYVDADIFEDVYNRDEWAFLSNPASLKQQMSSYIRCRVTGDTFINTTGLLMKVDDWHAQYLEKVSK